MMNNLFNDMVGVLMKEVNKEENIKKINIILDPYIRKIEMKFYFFIILLYAIYILSLIIIIYILFYYKSNLIKSVENVSPINSILSAESINSIGSSLSSNF
mgnify:CR=1 FL=1